MTLRSGDTGDDVLGLQTFLAAKGYGDDDGDAIEPDGRYGEKTAQAVAAFQRERGLTADGVFGPLTESAAVAAGYSGGAVERIEGVDVSQYSTDVNGASLIDWPALVPAPKFFWARASCGVMADKSFALHRDDGSSIDAIGGAYHFFVAGDDPAAQARTWRAAAGDQQAGSTLRPAIDIEHNSAAPLSDAEAASWASAARALVTQAEELFARELVVYINPKTAYELRNHLGRDFWSSRLLWLSQYTNGKPTIPAPWTAFAAHQFAGDVAMPGARCMMDRNVIYGAATLRALCS